MRGALARRTVATVLTGTLAASPLAYGYYDLTAWAPLGLGLVIVLVGLALGPAPRLGRTARVALLGGGLLLALSFASLLWAPSRESAWTSANLIAVYATVFLIGLATVRTRVTAWSVTLLIGLPGLVWATVLVLEFLTGAGSGAFLSGRLNAPMGYANATAALLVMGVWPWLGLAESAPGPRTRSVAVGAATLIASTAVLTQTRAILFTAGLAIVLGLASARRRPQRAVNVLAVLMAVLACAPWTLNVYRSTGPTHMSAPRSPVLLAAGLAVLGAAALACLLRRLALGAAGRLPHRWRERSERTLGRGLLALLALGVIALAVAQPGQVATQWHDFTTSRDEPGAGNRFLALGGGYRYDIWRVAVEEFQDAPLGGVGAGNYPSQEYRLRRRLEHVSDPHSLELQMLSELGVGGVVGLVLFVAAVLAAGLTRRRQGLTRADPGLCFATLGVFTAWLAGASVDWLYVFPGLTGLALLAAAVLLAPAQGSTAARSETPGRGRARVGLALGLGLLALLAASLGRQYLGALYRDSGRGLVPSRPLAALAQLRTAESLDPWSLETRYAMAAAYARLDDYASAEASLRSAQQLEPGNYVPPALLGDIATRAGLPGVALREYQRALMLDPLEPVLRQAVRRAQRTLRRTDRRA